MKIGNYFKKENWSRN